MSNASDFVIENGVLKKYVGPGGDVVIPDGVTEIGIQAFARGGQLITSIEMPRSVTMIQLGAFYGCFSLRSITMHAGVTIERDYSGRRVGVETIGECRSIKEIVFSENCDDAVLNQFWECFIVKSTNNTESAMKTVTLYSLLKYTPDFVLKDPEKAKKIKSGKKILAEIAIDLDDAETMAKAFSLHKSIKPDELDVYLEKAKGAVTVTAFLMDYKEKQHSGKKTAVETLKLETVEKPISLSALKKIWDWEDNTDGSVSINHYKGKNVDVVIPAMLKDLPVTSVGKSCFSSVDRRITSERREFFEEQMQSVEVSSGISSIGEYAFASCQNLHTIQLADTVNAINAKAFHFCKYLTKISGLENVKRIGRGSFECCYSLSGDLYLSHAINIEAFAISQCKEKLNLHFTNTVTYIDSFAFSGCSNVTIYAPVGSYAETYAKENNIPFVAE